MQKSELRKQELLTLLKERGRLSVREIADAFSVSLPTVRRLCAALAEDGKVVRTHGGIQLLPDVEAKYLFEKKDREAGEEKVRIAQYAVTQIRDGQIIFLESGTTVRRLALSIAQYRADGLLPNIKIFTNSLINLQILSPVCSVTLVGGLYRPERHDFIGYIGERIIRGLRFDHCFIGADAINLTDGIMASDVETVRFDELLISRSDQVSVLASSDKFSKHSLISYAGLHEITTIITDTGIAEDMLLGYDTARADVVCV